MPSMMVRILMPYQVFHFIIRNFFSTDGELRQIDESTGEPGRKPFEFKVMPDNHNYNQRHYEAIGDLRVVIANWLLLISAHHRRSVQTPGNKGWLEKALFASSK